MHIAEWKGIRELQIREGGDAKQSDTNKKRRYNDIKSDKRESKEHRHFTYQ